MSRFVLDTSVAIAWYLPEVFSEEAKHWRDQLLDGRCQLVVPSLHFWEMANVLRTCVKRRELEIPVARRIFEVHLDAPLTTADPNKDAVFDTAVKYDSSVYDAVYISLSLAQSIPLLTAEKTTTPWVVRLGNQVRSVRS